MQSQPFPRPAGHAIAAGRALASSGGVCRSAPPLTPSPERTIGQNQSSRKGETVPVQNGE